MTAPEPSGCAITGDTRAAAALLAADPPELGAIYEAIGHAHASGHAGVYLDLTAVDELIGTVQYLRGERDRYRATLYDMLGAFTQVVDGSSARSCWVSAGKLAQWWSAASSGARPPGGEG